MSSADVALFHPHMILLPGGASDYLQGPTDGTASSNFY